MINLRNIIKGNCAQKILFPMARDNLRKLELRAICDLLMCKNGRNICRSSQYIFREENVKLLYFIVVISMLLFRARYFEESRRNLYRKYLQSVIYCHLLSRFSSMINLMKICRTNGESDKRMRICMHMIN